MQWKRFNEALCISEIKRGNRPAAHGCGCACMWDASMWDGACGTHAAGGRWKTGSLEQGGPPRSLRDSSSLFVTPTLSVLRYPVFKFDTDYRCSALSRHTESTRNSCCARHDGCRCSSRESATACVFGPFLQQRPNARWWEFRGWSGADQHLPSAAAVFGAWPAFEPSRSCYLTTISYCWPSCSSSLMLLYGKTRPPTCTPSWESRPAWCCRMRTLQTSPRVGSNPCWRSSYSSIRPSGRSKYRSFCSSDGSARTYKGRKGYGGLFLALHSPRTSPASARSNTRVSCLHWSTWPHTARPPRQLRSSRSRWSWIVLGMSSRTVWVGQWATLDIALISGSHACAIQYAPRRSDEMAQKSRTHRYLLPGRYHDGGRRPSRDPRRFQPSRFARQLLAVHVECHRGIDRLVLRELTAPRVWLLWCLAIIVACLASFRNLFSRESSRPRATPPAAPTSSNLFLRGSGKRKKMRDILDSLASMPDAGHAGYRQQSEATSDTQSIMIRHDDSAHDLGEIAKAV